MVNALFSYTLLAIAMGNPGGYGAMPGYSDNPRHIQVPVNVMPAAAA